MINNLRRGFLRSQANLFAYQTISPAQGKCYLDPLLAGARRFATVVEREAEKDYYQILNVPSTATAEEIKDAYRRLAKKYHPDLRSQ